MFAHRSAAQDRLQRVSPPDARNIRRGKNPPIRYGLAVRRPGRRPIEPLREIARRKFPLAAAIQVNREQGALSSSGSSDEREVLVVRGDGPGKIKPVQVLNDET